MGKNIYRFYETYKNAWSRQIQNRIIGFNRANLSSIFYFELQHCYSENTEKIEKCKLCTLGHMHVMLLITCASTSYSVLVVHENLYHILCVYVKNINRSVHSTSNFCHKQVLGVQTFWSLIAHSFQVSRNRQFS